MSANGDAAFVGNANYVSTSGMACDSSGTMYVCAASLNAILKLAEAGTPTLVQVAGAGPGSGAASGFQDGPALSVRLGFPDHPVFDAQDNLYFIDSSNFAVRKLSPAGVVSTVAGNPANTVPKDGQGQAAGFGQPRAMALLPDGNLLVVDGTRLRKVTPGGNVTTLPATVSPNLLAGSLAVQDANTVYAIYGHSIVKLTLDGTSSTVAGVADISGYTEGTGTNARFGTPSGAVLDSRGQLLVADRDNHVVRQVAPPSAQTIPVLGRAPQPGYVDGLGEQARFTAIGATAVDAAGNVYVIDAQQNLRKITPAGQVSTLLQNFPASPFTIPLLNITSIGGLAVDPSGSFFYGVRNRTIVKVALDGSTQVLAGQAGVVGFSDGQGAQATFAQPLALVLDPQGNLLVADAPVMQVTVTEVNVFAVTYTYGTTIRKITPSGMVSTLAGTPGKTNTYTTVFGAARGSGIDRLDSFVAPLSMALDGSGNLCVSDMLLRKVKRLAPDGSISIVLDNNTSITQPSSLAASTSGRLYTLVGSTVGRLENDGTTTPVAGGQGTGVRIGTLPASLNSPTTGLVAGPGNTLYCCSENSVLRITLP